MKKNIHKYKRIDKEKKKYECTYHIPHQMGEGVSMIKKNTCRAIVFLEYWIKEKLFKICMFISL